MTLKIHHDGEKPGALRERCCMCRVFTNFWHSSDVALCQDCATTTKRSALPTKKEWCAKESKIFLKGGEAVRKEQSQSSTQKAAQMITKKAVAALKKIIKLQNEINDLKVIVELAISEKFGNDSGLSHAASDGWCLDVSGGFGGLTPISPELLNELLCMNAEQARLKLEYTSI